VYIPTAIFSNGYISNGYIFNGSERKFTCWVAGGEEDSVGRAPPMLPSGRLREDDFQGDLLRSVLQREHERGWVVFISTLGTVVDWAWIFTRPFTRATGSNFLIPIVYICNTPPYRGSTRDALSRDPNQSAAASIKMTALWWQEEEKSGM
jgi:hypothetical protein